MSFDRKETKSLRNRKKNSVISLAVSPNMLQIRRERKDFLVLCRCTFIFGRRVFATCWNELRRKSVRKYCCFELVDGLSPSKLVINHQKSFVLYLSPFLPKFQLKGNARVQQCYRFKLKLVHYHQNSLLTTRDPLFHT